MPPKTDLTKTFHKRFLQAGFPREQGLTGSSCIFCAQPHLQLLNPLGLTGAESSQRHEFSRIKSGACTTGGLQNHLISCLQQPAGSPAHHQLQAELCQERVLRGPGHGGISGTSADLNAREPGETTCSAERKSGGGRGTDNRSVLIN